MFNVSYVDAPPGGHKHDIYAVNIVLVPPHSVCIILVPRERSSRIGLHGLQRGHRRGCHCRDRRWRVTLLIRKSDGDGSVHVRVTRQLG